MLQFSKQRKPIRTKHRFVNAKNDLCVSNCRLNGTQTFIDYSGTRPIALSALVLNLDPNESSESPTSERTLFNPLRLVSLGRDDVFIGLAAFVTGDAVVHATKGNSA